jgi:hypothetical protein
MKLLQGYYKKAGVLFLAIVLLSCTVAFGDQHEFKVHNASKSAIKKLLASEDGEKYGFFDIGVGIDPGQTVKLVWDKSTDEQSCSQYFKAVFEDGSESAAEKFDFCDSSLVLEFSE